MLDMLLMLHARDDRATKVLSNAGMSQRSTSGIMAGKQSLCSSLPAVALPHYSTSHARVQISYTGQARTSTATLGVGRPAAVSV